MRRNEVVVGVDCLKWRMEYSYEGTGKIVERAA
jgi:hypothetical protein